MYIQLINRLLDVFILVYCLFFYNANSFTFLSLGYLYDLLRLSVLLLFIIGIIINIYYLGFIYFKHLNSNIAITLKIIIYSNIIAFFPFIMGYAVPLLIFRTPFISGEIAILCF
ncbi:hypothetical protein KHA80_15695 [Anaerobacillus sp. HL2]|nr:hypothetical protein KHA80_15695 [Anaerobacillus sp. HL2]